MPSSFILHIHTYTTNLLNEHKNIVMILVMLLLKLGHQAAVTSLSTGTQREIKNAKLEEPLTLKCTYNCSSGFTRGHWKWEDTPACNKCEWRPEYSKSGEMCIASLYTPHLMLQQTRYNYSCVSEESDRPGLPRKTELLVTLNVPDESHKPVTPLKEHGPSLRVKMYRGHMESDEVLTSLSTIEVMAGTSLRLLCVAPDNKHCEGQWVKGNSSIPLSKNDTVVQWSQIKAEDGGRYRCQTKGTCTGKPITVEIEVIESGEQFLNISLTFIYIQNSPSSGVGIQIDSPGPRSLLLLRCLQCLF
ncbi:hypothetical protein IRJ41_009197 [Triplophysa rosa]|uniref:Ig-like domain-containing protein n=1 Tax=Triplophysa rosa TaxID=992332 RepID=A0A9W7WID8_TRIRA|nr:hypothetical protein IRJ41_009197 [Triplophysa rosa]